MFLRVHWRTYLRHNLNPSDYFSSIKEKYGDIFNYSELTTTYVQVSAGEIANYRSRNFVIGTDSSIIIKEMVGICPVASEAEAVEMVNNLDDGVIAEYVRTFRLDRCPE